MVYYTPLFWRNQVNTSMDLSLIVDMAGSPRAWATPQDAVGLYVCDKVIWETGSKIRTLYGGINRITQIQSSQSVSSIIGVRGQVKDYPTVRMSRKLLYARDHNICAYCGDEFTVGQLTIDHVLPRSRGGRDTWTNCVTSCQDCNQSKGNRTPDEWGIKLIYVPYAVNQYEKMILSNRNILADQMEFLISRVPADSPLRYRMIG